MSHAPEELMSKNILILSDGTGQAGGIRPDQRLSNIYKLYRATRNGPDSSIDPTKQIAFYDPGLGSADVPSPGLLQLATIVRKYLSSAFGVGLTRNAADCYEHILEVYEPGDRVFLFGFSRGAYTVRTVAGVMNLCGVPIRDSEGKPIPRVGRALRKIADEAVHYVYEHGAGRDRAKYELEREEKARRFRVKYGTEDHETGQNMRGNAPPYFIGVFDTVAALGASGFKRVMLSVLGAAGVAGLAGLVSWLLGFLHFSHWWSFSCVIVAIGLIALVAGAGAHLKVIRDFPKPGNFKWHWSVWHFKFYDQFLDPRVGYARHAISIDETRKDFALVGWGASKDVTVARKDWMISKWFAGNHSDIGGSYPEIESRLSDIALRWLAKEAEGIPNGVVIDWTKLNTFPDPSGMQHCEVTAVRDMYPSWVPMSLRKSWDEDHRMYIKLENCDPSVRERIGLATVSKCGISEPYRPIPLSKDPELAALYAAAPPVA
jgi:uncharacterized protein (DUF2235 family)